MLELPKIIQERRDYSSKRIDDLQNQVSRIPSIAPLKDLCIYVTGSFGRLEASPYSDLDLFFLSTGQPRSNSPTRIEKTLLDADLITKCRDMGFPEFSNDGQYLEIHYVDEMKEKLGGSQDDYLNLFTARMLLLLESRPITNDKVYRQIVENVIGAYYRDYDSHEKDFRPVFLVNDLVRFWKTLCLNYEHKRERGESPDKRTKAQLRNLKLKFSRLLTCFSAIILLSKNKTVVTPDKLAALVTDPPLRRLEAAAAESKTAEGLANSITGDYSWFLEMTGRPSNEVLKWIADAKQRDEAFERARVFGKNMYDLLVEVTKGSEIVRYLVM